jgi:DNA-binding LytR/AlgR family response regulator
LQTKRKENLNTPFSFFYKKKKYDKKNYATRLIIKVLFSLSLQGGLKISFLKNQTMFRIFILEDDTFQFNRIQATIAQDGFECVRAESSSKALDLLKNEQFDLGILDVELDEDKNNGFTIAQKIQDKRLMPIIFLTNHYDNIAYLKKANEVGVPTKYFLQRERLNNPKAFIDTLYEAIEGFQYPVTPLQYVAFSHRKIGIKVDKEQYQFFGKDEIVCLSAERGYTYIHFAHRPKLLVTTNLGKIAAQIQRTYYNFMKLGQSHFVNLEKIIALQGKVLILKHNIRINLSEGGIKKLKAANLIIKTS